MDWVKLFRKIHIHNVCKPIIWALFFTTIISCVGAITEAEEEEIVRADITKTPDFTFEGISKVEAVSDTKLNIFFKPAKNKNQPASDTKTNDGGTIVNFVYEVLKDGSDTAIATFVDSNLEANPNGEYIVEIPSDGRGKCATYSIVATKAENQVSISSKNFFKGCAEDTFFPKFDGLFNVTALAGCAIYNGARLNWKVAENSDELEQEIARFENLKEENLNQFSNGSITLDIFNSNNTFYDSEINKLKKYSPASYQIYYADTEDALLAKLIDPNTIPNAVVADANQTSIDISGLDAGKQYHFAVRASTLVIPELSKKNVERNLISKDYSIPESQPVEFTGVTEVSIPKNINGYNQATMRFEPCDNCDRYYFYAENAPRTIDIETDTPDAVVDLNSAGTNPDNYTIGGLQPHKDYYFYAIAINNCSGGANPESKGQGTFKTLRTTPPLAPFNGIQNITTIGGNLDRLKIDWELPDTSSGVYDEYNVYQTDPEGNILRQLSNTPHPTNPYILSTEDITDPSTTEITVVNVDAGLDSSNPNNYCFVVAPKESDANGPSGVGREIPSADWVVQCKDFFYKAPQFNGPNAGSCNNTASTFQVNFPIPTEGTFSEFRLYYKVDAGESIFDYETAEADTMTVVNDRGAGANYTRIVFRYDPLADPPIIKPAFADTEASTIPFTISGLDPDTTYVFAMETFYDPDGPGPAEAFYVRPATMRRCTTTKPEVVHEGWDHIMALGQKSNGLDNSSIINQKIPISIKTKFNFLMSGLGSDTDYLDSYFIEEDPLANNTKAHVHLSWFDFKFSNNGGYANTIASGPSTVEYIVERSQSPDMAGAIQIGSPVTVTNGVFLYHFFDEDIPLSGIKYYYRVKLRIDGIDLNFASTDPTEAAINAANAIIDVVSPPSNMAFVHRKIYNKHQCRRIDKSIWHGRHTYNDVASGASNINLNYENLTHLDIRNIRGSLYKSPTNRNYDLINNYRCNYNGLGSIYDSVADDYFFDIGKSFLVDRYENGFKIGKGKCDQGGSYGGPMDCVSETVNAKGIAEKDTIFFRLHESRYAQAYINLSVEGVPSNSWTTVDTLSETQFSSLSNKIVSNEAYLPPARFLNHRFAEISCENRLASIDGTDYEGRLGSRQEFIVFGAFYEQLSALGILQTSTRMDLGAGDDIKKMCNTLREGENRVPYQSQELIIDTSKNNYPSRNNGNSRDIHSLRTGSYSDGLDPTNLHSSHLCFSKFGLQDIVGNEREFSAEWFYDIDDDNSIRLDLSKTPIEIQKYWLNTANAPLPPAIPNQDHHYGSHMSYMHDGYQQYSFINSNVNYFWNPISATNFKCRDSIWGVVGCKDDSIENLTALKSQNDSDNYIFSSASRDKNNSWMNFPQDGRPGVLAALASDLSYIPFNYEFNVQKLVFNRKTNTSPMTYGGASYYSNWDENPNPVNPASLGHSRMGVYSTGFSNTNSSYRRAGFRCVFPLD